MPRNSTVKEIAKILHISEVWVRELAKKGKIPATKKGHYWYFNISEVERVFYKDNSFVA